MQAVAQVGESLRWASEQLQDDKEVVMKAVTKDGKSLEYASEELKKDKEVVVISFSHN